MLRYSVVLSDQIAAMDGKLASAFEHSDFFGKVVGGRVQNWEMADSAVRL